MQICSFFFFFQAEDGIRDLTVTGVQTCALPISIYTRIAGSSEASDKRHNVNGEQWELLRDNVPALISAVSGGGTSGVNLKAGSHVEYVHAGRVSAHY